MHGVLGPDDFGLVNTCSSIKYLNLNPIMHGILGPDDFGLVNTLAVLLSV